MHRQTIIIDIFHLMVKHLRCYLRSNASKISDLQIITPCSYSFFCYTGSQLIWNWELWLVCSEGMAMMDDICYVRSDTIMCVSYVTVQKCSYNIITTTTEIIKICKEAYLELNILLMMQIQLHSNHCGLFS